ncbi:pentatricopeptide repeat-containing protein [Tanacetum coccineum]
MKASTIIEKLREIRMAHQRRRFGEKNGTNVTERVVVGLVIANDQMTGNPRGFAFISFTDASVLNKALADTHTILGRMMKGNEVEKSGFYDEDDELGFMFIKRGKVLSPGEEELIKLRNRMKANRKAKAKAKDKRDEEMNEPNKENSMHANTVRCEKHDIYMNELLKSLKTTDKDGITKDPFISVENM